MAPNFKCLFPLQLRPLPVAVPGRGLRRLLPLPDPQPGLHLQWGQGRGARGRRLVGRLRRHLRAFSAMVSIYMYLQSYKVQCRYIAFRIV